jgi:hypothetical protein
VKAIGHPIFKYASRGSSTSVRAIGADLMISANPGCSMQITRALGDQGNALHVAHIAKVIDAPVRSRPRPSALPNGNGANAPARGSDLLFAGDQSAFRNLVSPVASPPESATAGSSSPADGRGAL